MAALETARIAELDRAIAAAEAEGADHYDLNGARDFHRAGPFHKLAFDAGRVAGGPTEQPDHFNEWIEGFKAEAEAARRSTTQRKAA